MRFSNHHIHCLAILLLVLGVHAPMAAGQSDSARFDPGASSPDLKSKTVARGLSFGATAGTAGVGVADIMNQNRRRGLLLIGTGLMMGPSAGFLYAEAPGRALRGIGIRAGIGAGTALVTVGGALVVESSEGSWAALGVLAGGVLGGTGVVLGHGLHDTFRGTAQAVEAHNESAREAARRERAAASVTVEPWASPETGTPGLQVRVSF